MNDEKQRLEDPLVDEVRRVREKLVREHGGLKGWFEALQRRQAEHPEKLVDRRKRETER